jgi:hypothetical protein
MNNNTSIARNTSSRSRSKNRRRVWQTPYQNAESFAIILLLAIPIPILFFPKHVLENSEYLKWWLLLGTVVFVLSQIFLFESLRFGVRKKGLLSREPHSSIEYLNQTISVPVPLVADKAWACTKENLGEIIKAKGSLRLSLRYVHDPLGKKPWQLVARQIECRLALKANGVNSNLNLEFKANSPMDYATVKEIIDQTKVAFAKIPEISVA